MTHSAKRLFVDFPKIMTLLFLVCVSSVFAQTGSAPGTPAGSPAMALIPGGEFEMGDHQGFVDPKHGGDETPLHTVRLDSFRMGIFDITTLQYCDFLNSARKSGSVEARRGGVYLSGGGALLVETCAMS